MQIIRIDLITIHLTPLIIIYLITYSLTHIVMQINPIVFVYYAYKGNILSHQDPTHYYQYTRYGHLIMGIILLALFETHDEVAALIFKL